MIRSLIQATLYRCGKAMTEADKLLIEACVNLIRAVEALQEHTYLMSTDTPVMFSNRVADELLSVVNSWQTCVSDGSAKIGDNILRLTTDDQQDIMALRERLQVLSSSHLAGDLLAIEERLGTALDDIVAKYPVTDIRKHFDAT